jgi:subtilisin family serine protease
MDVGKALTFFSYLGISLGALGLSGCGLPVLGSNANNNQKTTSGSCAQMAIPNEYIVRWKDGTHSLEKASSHAHIRSRLSAESVDKIDFIEPNYRVQIHGQPSASVHTNSFFHNSPDSWGQSAIGADQVWSTAKGDGVIVAVVDAGVDVTHVQLRNQIAINKGEVPNNGVDDDKNGFVDDYAGYDFYAGNGNVHDAPKSTHHGSHVAGIIGAEHLSTGAGIRGVAPGVKILPLTFMDDTGSGNISDALNAISYAVSRGAKVINASWGAEVCSQSLQLTIASLESQGVLFVAAAGNGDQNGIGYNLDYRQTFPAAYGIAGQVTVGAMDDAAIMTGFSNFSRNLVHLLSPGLDIWSTVYDDGTSPNHGYLRMDGTSMATPFVSGAAAVLWSYRPKATVQQIKAAILTAVTPGNYPVVANGYLNLRQALDTIGKTVAP